MVAGKSSNATTVVPACLEMIELFARPEGDSCLNLLRDSSGEFRRGNFIQRNGNRPTQHAAIKGGDPLPQVAPKQDALALLHAKTFEFPRDLCGSFRDLRYVQRTVRYPLRSMNAVSDP